MAASPPRRLAGRVGALRPRLATTPGRLRLGAAAIVLVAIAFGVVGATAAARRHDAAATAASQTEPLLVQAVGLHDALADADATASATFVIGGAEPMARRRRYLADIAAASAALTAIGRRASTTEERAAVAAIGRDLPVYTGLTDTARADNRQGFPVGAAYLRQASGLMRGQILPAAASIYAVEGRDLQRRYRAGASTTAVVAVAGVALVMLAVLVGVQIYLVRLTHRRLNLPLVAATVVLVGVGAWGLLGLSAEQQALMRAQRDGSDPVEVLSAVRVLALRAQTDEGLSLAARGSGDDSLADFDTAMRVLGTGRGSGLLAETAALTGRHGSAPAVARLGEQISAYRAVHGRVVSLEQEGDFNGAANLSVGGKGRELALADTIRRDLDRLIASGQARFHAAAADAVGATQGLWLVIPLLALVSALSGLYGLRMRLKEYR